MLHTDKSPDESGDKIFVNIEQYNAEIEDAMGCIDAGEFYEHEEVEEWLTENQLRTIQYLERLL